MVSRSSWYVRHRYRISTIIKKLCFDIVKRTMEWPKLTLICCGWRSQGSRWVRRRSRCASCGAVRRRTHAGRSGLRSHAWVLTARLRGACWPRSERRWHLPVPQDGHQGPRARESHLRAASRPKGGQNKGKRFATDPHKSKRRKTCSSFTGRGYFNCNGYSLLESKQYLVSTLFSNFFI